MVDKDDDELDASCANTSEMASRIISRAAVRQSNRKIDEVGLSSEEDEESKEQPKK